MNIMNNYRNSIRTGERTRCRQLAAALCRLMLIVFALVPLMILKGIAATYHVSPSGLDTNPGTSAAAPWKTITKANTTLVAGDTVLIHAGTYSGQAIDPNNSGSAAGGYITYKAANLAGYPAETQPVITSPPTVTIGSRTPKVGIVLDGNHHIWVEGVKVSGGSADPPLGTGANLHSWAVLNNANSNVITANNFIYAKGWSGMSLQGANGSSYNKITGNQLWVCGTYDAYSGTNKSGGCMVSDAFTIWTLSDHNLIEGNDMSYGGHNVFNIEGSFNVFRGNYFNNNWSKFAAEVLGQTLTTDIPSHVIDGNDNVGYRIGEFGPGADNNAEATQIGVGYNLFENNILTGVRQPYYGSLSNFKNSPVMKVIGTGQIVRNNYYFDNIGGGLAPGVLFDGVKNFVYFARNHHLYNNTFFDMGGMVFDARDYEDSTGRLDQNVFMNNLVFLDRQNAAYATSIFDVDVKMENKLGPASVVLETNKFFNNSFLKASEAGGGDGKFYVNTVGVQTREFYEANYPLNFFNNIERDPLFVTASGARDTKEEFDVQPGSPMIDAGAFLTTTTAASGNTNVVAVLDAGYFFPGISQLGVAGDLVKIGTNALVQVTAVNYTNNTLTLASAVSWSGGAANVNLDYRGAKPDIGAREFASGGALPAAPSNLIATTNGSNRIDLAWTDSSTNETQFRIERQVGAGSFALLTNVAAIVGSGGTGIYSDTNLNSGTAYTYRVRADGSNGNSDWSAEASATTPSGGGSVTNLYEAELLPATGSSGDVISTYFEAQASAGTNSLLTANATNDFITYTVNVPAAGAYNVRVRLPKFSNCGKCFLYLDGSASAQGAEMDLYNASVFAYEEVDLGDVTFTNAGNHFFKFQVSGKNASATSYKLTFDYLKLIGNSPLPPPAITGASVSSNNFVISFSTEVGGVYEVQRTDTLTPPAWTSIATNLPGTGGTIQIADTSGINQLQRFYRVKLAAP
jgi:hypothetical protein